MGARARDPFATRIDRLVARAEIRFALAPLVNFGRCALASLRYAPVDSYTDSDSYSDSDCAYSYSYSYSDSSLRLGSEICGSSISNIERAATRPTRLGAGAIVARPPVAINQATGGRLGLWAQKYTRKRARTH